MAEHRQLPPQELPYPYLRAGYLGTDPLLVGAGVPVDLEVVDADDALRRGLDLVTVGARDGRRIDDHTLAVLTACEREGVPTLLHTGSAQDLDSPTAAVVSHIATSDASLLKELRPRVGPERAVLAEQPIDPREALLAGQDDAASCTPEAVSHRRELVATRSPRAVADRLLAHLGIPVAPVPLVTVLLVARNTEHLDVALTNLQRQAYPRLDPVLVINPLHAEAARAATAEWDVPLRIITSVPRSTLADRLNTGIAHAHGEVVAVFEQTVQYGPFHLVDSLQALEHSGAQVVGRASWFVADPATGEVKITKPAKQRTFGEMLAAAGMVMRRETAQRYGFVRRAGVNWPIQERVIADGGTTYSIHAFDMVVPARGAEGGGVQPSSRGFRAFPFDLEPNPSARPTRID